MQTQLADFIRDSAAGREADEILRKCVHCGFCTATCPTYQLLGDELDGPRGRIYLIKQALEGQPVTERTVEFRIMQARSRVLTSARPSQALEYYSQRMDSGIEGIGERYGAALAMAELGNFEPAREVLKPALEQAPRQASLLLLNARILAGLRQDEAALAEYRTVIEHHPRYAPALLALAETLMDQGAHGEARQHLLDNLTALRDHADTHRLLARAAREVDDTAELAYQSAAFAWHRGDAPTALSHLDAGLRVASLSAQERARLTAFRRDLRGTLPNNWRPQEP